MKRIVALLLVFSMLATLGLSAFAAEAETEIKGTAATTADQKGSADVYTTTTNADEWWAVQIPADKSIEWGVDSETNMGCKVAAQLKEGSTISVKVEAATTTLVQQNSGDTHETIAYTNEGLGEAKTYTNAAYGTGSVTDGAVTVIDWADYSSDVKIKVAGTAFQSKPIDKYSVTLTYTVTVTAPAGD